MGYIAGLVLPIDHHLSPSGDFTSPLQPPLKNHPPTSTPWDHPQPPTAPDVSSVRLGSYFALSACAGDLAVVARIEAGGFLFNARFEWLDDLHLKPDTWRFNDLKPSQTHRNGGLSMLNGD